MDSTTQAPASDEVEAVSTGSSETEPSWGDGGVELSYREVLASILLDGSGVAAGSSNSVGDRRSTLERRNHSFEIADGRDRIVPLKGNHIRATLAVGRFLWMMAGNDRLDDVRFYESSGLGGDRKKGVGQFSADGLSISGSNYGQRLLRPRPGIDQVAACIERVRQDPNTRRAAMTVYQPEDAGRESFDIPCTFGVLLSPRDGRLHQTVVMRSNNAWMLLPYNIFEFSLLGELIASESDLDVGSYHHFAVSMHLYEDDFESAREAVSSPAFVFPAFGPMPKGSLARVHDLCRWESSMRYASAGYSKRDAEREMKRVAGFGEYWSQFARVALYKGLMNAGREDVALRVADSIDGPLAELLRIEMAELNAKRSPSAENDRQLQLFKTRESPIPDISAEQLAELQSSVDQVEDDKVHGRFYIMMMRERLAERRAHSDPPA